LKHVPETKMGKTDRLRRRLDWKVKIKKDNNNQVFVTNFIQLVSPQQVDRFSQTKLHWEAPNEGYPHIYRMHKSDNK